MNLILKSGLQAAGLVFAAAATVIVVVSFFMLVYQAAAMLGGDPAGLLAVVGTLMFLVAWGAIYAAASE